jgi:uncharacterized protein DUF6916
MRLFVQSLGVTLIEDLDYRRVWKEKVMAATLTEDEFSQHLNTMFRVNIGAPHPVELCLVEVKGYEKKTSEAPGMERFSLFFSGPGDCYLPQKTYPFEHDQMGAFDLFLVPISKDESGYRYEAVFNYFNES